MKREVDCLPCGRAWPDKSPPREFIKKTIGYANADFVCDGCDKKLPKGTPVICVSVWASYGGIQYYPWEEAEGFIAPMSRKELDAYERLEGTKT